MDPTQKAFEFANEGTRQLLTLSAAILALTITLAERIDSGKAVLLAAAWVAFLVSIVCGIWTLFALTFELDTRAKRGARAPTVTTPAVRRPSFAQIGTFVLGTAFLMLFGISAL